MPLAQHQLHLLSEEAGSQGVQDGVQGTVDRKDEYYHPRCDGSLKGNEENREKSIEQKCTSHKLSNINVWQFFRNPTDVTVETGRRS